MKGLQLLSYFLFLLLIPTWVLGQDECDNPINEASKQFEAGRLNETISILESCIDNKNTNEEKIAAYHLLAMSYLSLNETDRAEEYVIKLLNLKPNYQKYPNIDPPEFSRLVNDFEIFPKLSVGIHLGVNRNAVRIKKSFSAYSSPQRYYPLTGNSLGILFDYNASENIEILGSALFEVMGVKHVVDNAGGREQSYEEQLKFITFKPGVQYIYPINDKISFTPGGGISLNYLYQSNVFLESFDKETGNRVQSIQNPIKQRNRFQPGLFLQCGVQWPVSKGTMNIGLGRYSAFRTTVNQDKRLDDLAFIFNNQYVNDDIKLRSWSLNVQYMIPISWNIEKVNQSPSNDD